MPAPAPAPAPTPASAREPGTSTETPQCSTRKRMQLRLRPLADDHHARCSTTGSWPVTKMPAPKTQAGTACACGWHNYSPGATSPMPDPHPPQLNTLSSRRLPGREGVTSPRSERASSLNAFPMIHVFSTIQFRQAFIGHEMHRGGSMHSRGIDALKGVECIQGA
jgi:hypothetical protein